VKRVLVGRILARHFDRFLTTGSLGEAYLAACGVASRCVTRFPYAVDHAAFTPRSAESRSSARAQWQIPEGAIVILSLAKFSQRELPSDLAGACKALSSRRELFWIFAGDGPRRSVLERELAGLERVRLPGYVPYSELPSLYAAADCFVHPALEERWGVSVAEALAAGLPVVTSNRVGAAFDLVSPGENGDRYPVGDVSALARALERTLALDPHLVASSSARLLAPFGLQATWRSLVDLATEVRAASGRGAP
jgi:glycosyltransferase involved in cell wall biosynthesis